MIRRLGSVNTALGLDPSRPLLIMNARGKTFAAVADIVERTIVKYDIGFVVLDSISRAGMGNLTEDRPANMTIDILNRFEIAWLALAHTARTKDKNLTDQHIFGSTMFDAGADIVVQLHSANSSETSKGVGLIVTKANDIAHPPMEVLSYRFDDFGLVGVKRSSVKEHPRLIALERVDLRDDIKEHLLDIGRASASEIAEALGKDRSNVSRLLSADSEFVGTKVGKTVQYAVKSRRESI